MSTQILSVTVVLGLALISEINALTQNNAETTESKVPVVFTTQQDHQNMLDQLGITELRPGRSNNEESPNAANYDESKANPYPVLPLSKSAAITSLIALAGSSEYALPPQKY